MAQIRLYKDLSDSKKLFEVENGATLKEALPYLDFTKFIVIVNGRKENENHIIREGDLILIRAIPSGVLAGALTSFAIGISILSVGVGIVSGVMMYQSNVEAEKARRQLDELKNNTQNSVINLPYLKGASNTVATGKTQPYFMGENLLAPYILNSGGNSYTGFSTIEDTNGKRQFYNVVLEGGFNKQSLISVFTDDIKIKEFGSVEPQEGIYTFDNESVFATKDSFMEIAQDGQPFETEIFNKKIVEEKVNAQLLKSNDENYSDLYFTLNKNSMAADVCILINGLRFYDTNGIPKDRKIEVIPSYSFDYADNPGNATWHEFTFENVKKVSDGVYKTHGATYTYNVIDRTRTLKNKTHFEITNLLWENQSSWVFVGGERFTPDKTMNLEYSIRENPDNFGNYTIYFEFSYEETISEPVYENVMSNEFTNNTMNQLRYNAHADFNFTDLFENNSGEWQRKYNSPVTIKLSCPTEKLDLGSVYDSVYVQWIHSYCFDEKKSKAQGTFIEEPIINSRESAVSTIYGFRMEATETNYEKLKKINVISCGLARTWNAESEEWNSEKVPTSNPASWLLEVLTSDKHAPSQVDDSEIDLDSFGELYTHCKLKNISFNRVIVDGDTKQNILESILSVCHAILYKNIYGLISVAIDDVKSNAVALINEQNVFNFEYEKTFGRIPDGVKITFINEEAGFIEDSLIVMADGSDPEERSVDSIITELNLPGITNYKQAFKYAIRYMKEISLRPKTVKARIGKEGIYYCPFDKILVSHPSLKIGLGSAEIESVVYDGDMVTGLILSDYVDLEADKEFNVLIECVSDSYCSTISKELETVTENTSTKEITFKVPFSAYGIIPHPGNILSYGYGKETVTSPFMITGIEPDNDTVTLTLIDYNEAVYSDDVNIPEYEPNLTTRNTSFIDSTPDKPSAPVPDIETVSKIVADTKQELEEEIAGISVSAVRVSASENQIKFHKTINETANFESQIVELQLFVNEVITDPEETIIDDSNLNGVSVVGEYDSENHKYILSLSTTYGGTKATGNLVVKMKHSNAFYTQTINVESVYTGLYLGGLSEVPESATIGSYFVYLGEDTENYKPSCVYVLEITTDENGDAMPIWKLDENADHNMTALKEILSLLDSENNTQSVELVKRLVASNVFVQNLFANEINVENFIQSANYEPTQIIEYDSYDEEAIYEVTDPGKGFRLNKNGVLNVNNIEVNGIEISQDRFMNTKLGHNALKRNTVSTGQNYQGNSAYGGNVLRWLDKGTANTGVGILSLMMLREGDLNTALGVNALGRLKKGVGNIGIGHNTYMSYWGNYNIAIGEAAFGNMDEAEPSTYAEWNVLIGKADVEGDNAKNNVCIGKDVETSKSNAHDEVNIANRFFIDESGVAYIGTSWADKNSVILSPSVISSNSLIWTIARPQSLTVGTVFKVFLNSDIYGNATTSRIQIKVNNTNYDLKVYQNGNKVNLPSHSFKHRVDTTSHYWFIQKGTELEILYDGTDFVVMGNPCVLSYHDTNKSYSVYADGLCEQWGTSRISGKNTIITLFIPYSSTSSYVALGVSNNDGGWGLVQKVTNSTFKYAVLTIASAVTTNADWFCKGYC